MIFKSQSVLEMIIFFFQKFYGPKFEVHVIHKYLQ